MTGFQALCARVTAITHQGRLRESNEDTIVVDRWVRNVPMDVPRQSLHEIVTPLLCLVADGMGGHAAGDVASRTAAFRLSEAAPNLNDPEGVTLLLRQLNREMFHAMEGDRSLLGMGTTLAGLLLCADKAIWFNVGDSRIYRYRDAFIRQLSIDDVPEPYVGRGLRSHGITQAVGGASSFVEIQPHVGIEPLVADWRYLLCSDGLTDMLPLEEIERAMATNDDASVAALFGEALDRGGEDNLSIILISIESGAVQRESTGTRENGEPHLA